MDKKPFSYLLLIGLCLALVAAYFEIQSLFLVGRDWGELFDWMGKLTLAGYLFLFAAGLAALFFALIAPHFLSRFMIPISHLGPIRWLAPVILTSCLTWFYLYSPWQDVWPRPWTEFLFAAGLAQLVALFAARQNELGFRGREMALSFALFLYPGIVLESRALSEDALVYRAVTLGGLILIGALMAFLYTSAGLRLSERLLSGRRRLGWARAPLIVLMLTAPLWFRYLAGAVTYITSPHLRFAVLFLACCAAAYLLERDPARLASPAVLFLSAGTLTLASSLTRSLLLVAADPFSLSWSEGNRLYDYSLVFAQNLYDHPGKIPDLYSTPGRYALWGVAFLWQGLPIWAHRLWNIVVQTVPVLAFAWLLARGIKNAALQAGLFLWISVFFVVQSPVHPPIMVVAIIVLIFVYHDSWLLRVLSLAAASIYAGISRWTWVVAPAAWGALSDLLIHMQRKDPPLRKILRAVGFTLAGLLPGVLMLNRISAGESQAGANALDQPLLWYRLLPNDTYPLGILFGTLLTTGPVLVILAWSMISRRWKLDWVQAMAVWGAVLGFLAAGLIISAKIGGGGDLHNLDMYLITLVFVAAVGLRYFAQNGEFSPSSWPLGVQAMLALLFLLPVYGFTPFSASAATHPYLTLPKPSEVSEAMAFIEQEVARASQQGQVLFMDQRQLLTFGYIRGVPLIPEYEKKYMMDQALGSNLPYFQNYYRDLAGHRFSLIVTEPLHLRLRTEEGVFPDENDAWVKWVSGPTLCFYEPLATYKEVGVQLLVPKQNPTGCEKYLGGGEP